MVSSWSSAALDVTQSSWRQSVYSVLLWVSVIIYGVEFVKLGKTREKKNSNMLVFLLGRFKASQAHRIK